MGNELIQLFIFYQVFHVTCILANAHLGYPVPPCTRRSCVSIETCSTMLGGYAAVKAIVDNDINRNKVLF